MNCLFCSNIFKKLAFGDSSTCSECSTRYYFSHIGELINYHFDAHHKGRRYSFHFYIDGGFNNTYPYFKLSYDLITMIQLDYLPNFTPHNAAQKLQTLLIFS